MKQLVVITTPAFFDGEADILTQLFHEGMSRLHIRKPDCRIGELEALLCQLPADFHRHIVLHDHFDLAMKHGLYGIHLNRRNGGIPSGFTGNVSRSYHTLDEMADLSNYNYVFLSPLFDSISKEGYPAAFSSEALEQAAEAGLINPKVIALGGMDSETITQIARFSFGGVAVLGALWGQSGSIAMEEVVTRFHLLQQCITQHIIL